MASRRIRVVMLGEREMPRRVEAAGVIVAMICVVFFLINLPKFCSTDEGLILGLALVLLVSFPLCFVLSLLARTWLVLSHASLIVAHWGIFMGVRVIHNSDVEQVVLEDEPLLLVIRLRTAPTVIVGPWKPEFVFGKNRSRRMCLEFMRDWETSRRVGQSKTTSD